jgi:hypothetical protein
LDNFTNPSSGNTLDSPSHSLQHSDINDAVEAMQRKVGVGTAVAGSASAGQVLTISAAGTSTWSTPGVPGLVQLVPSSVAVGSGSGSVDANGAVTFTGASTVSLNDVFSSTYDNYKVLMNITGSTTNQNVGMRLRVSGADNSTANYGQQLMDAASNILSGSRDSGQTSFARIAGAQSGKNQLFLLDIAYPFQTEITTAHTFRMVDAGTSSAQISYIVSGFVATTSFTGFTLIPGSGTITGTIRVYGYKN